MPRKHHYYACTISQSTTISQPTTRTAGTTTTMLHPLLTHGAHLSSTPLPVMVPYLTITPLQPQITNRDQGRSFFSLCHLHHKLAVRNAGQVGFPMVAKETRQNGIKFF